MEQGVYEVRSTESAQSLTTMECYGLRALVLAGKAEPLGPTRQGNAVNFAVFSQAATAMALVLHNPADGSRQEIPMNKSGAVPSVW